MRIRTDFPMLRVVGAILGLAICLLALTALLGDLVDLSPPIQACALGFGVTLLVVGGARDDQLSKRLTDIAEC